MEADGELIPTGGGDNIPLLRDKLTVGRREICDICLRFPDISGKHCELVFDDGYWTIRDLASTNGIYVNGERVGQKGLSPGDTISIGNKHNFVIQYTLPAGQRALEELIEDNIMDLPLLEKAGLVRPREEPRRNVKKKPR